MKREGIHDENETDSAAPAILVLAALCAVLLILQPSIFIKNLSENKISADYNSTIFCFFFQ